MRARAASPSPPCVAVAVRRRGVRRRRRRRRRRRPGRRSTVPAGGRCVVRLHGKGGTGAPTTTSGDVTRDLADGQRRRLGRQAVAVLPGRRVRRGAWRSSRDAVAGCGPIIVDGFSNGASFAAAMYCHGETFDGRLVRVIVDDPVTDHAVDDCTPDPSVSPSRCTPPARSSAGAGRDGSARTSTGRARAARRIGIEAWATARSACRASRARTPITSRTPTRPSCPTGVDAGLRTR